MSELLTGAVWLAAAGVAIVNGQPILLLVLLPLVSLLVLLLLYDSQHQLLPDIFVWPALGFGLLWTSLNLAPAGSFFYPLADFSALAWWPAFGLRILAGLGAAAFLLLLYVLTRGQGMGLGDVKLALVLGVVAGWPAILDVFFLAFCAGAITGIMYLGRGTKQLQSRIAFGPFLIASLFIVVFWHLYVPQ